MKISITEFLQGKEKCPDYVPKSQFNVNKNYNLNDPAERGQYLHNYVANYINNNIYFSKLNSKYDIEAVNAIKWLQNTFPDTEFIAEQPIEAIVDGHTVTGKPDAYAIKDNTLTVIDFKFTDNFVTWYFYQIVFYAGTITEQHTEIQTIELWIKNPGEPSYFCFDRNTLMQLYGTIISRVSSYFENARRLPCCECSNCKHKSCAAKLEQAASDILNAVYGSDNQDLNADEIESLLFALVNVEPVKDIYKDGKMKKTKGSFDGKNPEAVSLVADKSRGSADVTITMTVSAREAQRLAAAHKNASMSVSAGEAGKWLTVDEFDTFKTSKSSEKITEVAKKHCRWGKEKTNK